MAVEPLVLKDREFLGAKSLRLIQKANDLFDLGINEDFDALRLDIETVLGAFRNPNIGDADALLHVSLSRQSARGASPHRPINPLVEAWQLIGQPKIATLFQDWFDLADDVKIRVKYQGTEDAHPTVLNKADINAKCRTLDRKLGKLVETLPFDNSDIPDILCKTFNLELRADTPFNAYWTARIVKSPGFAQHTPSFDDAGIPHHEIFGWVTGGHVKALENNGIKYHFAFWEDPARDMFGDLWIQTDQGPLILTSRNDVASDERNFPVQVSNLSRKKLFRLKAGDAAKSVPRRSLFSRLLRRL